MNSEKKSQFVFERPLFTKIFQTFGMAVRPYNLIICSSALVVICLAGLIMDLADTVIVANDIRGSSELQVYINSPERVDSYIEDYENSDRRTGVFTTLWHFAEKRFQGAVYSVFALDPPGVLKNITGYFKAVIWAVKYHLIYSVIFFAITLALISIAGGAVCRTAVLQFAQGQKPGMTEAVRYSIKKFKSFFFAPLTPIVIILVIVILVSLLGMIGTIPVAGELIMIIFTPLALLAGVVITLLLIGTTAGINLMFPSVAYDGSDSFGAMNYSFHYVIKKPWRMAFYTAIAIVYGSICYIFVRFFTFLLLWGTHQSLQLGSKFISWIFSIFGAESNAVSKFAAVWPEPAFTNLFGSAVAEPVNWSQSIAGFLIYLLMWAFLLLLASFIMSFYFSANTIIYALMRKSVDDTALDDIYTLPEMEKTEPAVAETKAEEAPAGANQGQKDTEEQPESQDESKPEKQKDSEDKNSSNESESKDDS